MWGFPGGGGPPPPGQGIPMNSWMFAQPGLMGHPSMYPNFPPQEANVRGMQPRAPAGREEEPTAGGKTKRRKKKEKRVGPKKPATSFVVFSNSVRNRIKEENPGLSFTEVGRKLGEMWREMAPEEKKTYEDMALEAKEKYMEAKRIWLKEQVTNAEKQISAYSSDVGRDMGGAPGGGHHGMKPSESPMDMIQQLQAMAPMMQGGMPQGIGGIPGLPRMPGSMSGGPGHGHGMHPGQHP